MPRVSRIHEWLRPGGKLFVHVFCHRELTYLFEDQGEQDWMSRYFFTGGMMPGWDWLPECAGKLSLDERWAVNGEHYGKTLEAWLALADLRQETLVPLLDECYGSPGKVWLQRWRMFSWHVQNCLTIVVEKSGLKSITVSVGRNNNNPFSDFA